MDIEKIFPDIQAIIRVERRYPWKSPEANYTLAQKEVAIRLSGAKLSADGRTWQFPNGRRKVTSAIIRDHNRKVIISLFTPGRRWKRIVHQALQEAGIVYPVS